MPVLIVTVSLILLAIPFLNVRGRIAKYNVDTYLARAEQGIKDNHIDVSYLVHDLGSAGVPEAVRLLESGKLEYRDKSDLNMYLEVKQKYLQEHNDSLDQSLSDKCALKLLEQRNP